MLELTHKEQAAILLHLIEGVNDRGKLFEIANEEKRVNKLKTNEKSFNSSVSYWFRSHKIQEGIKYYQNLLEQIKNKAVQDYLNSSDCTVAREPESKKQSRNDINFLNPEEFLQFANSQANEIQDEKERREYLKMIANLMNYKEGDAEQTDIQRFYTPVICSECVIYQKCSRCNSETCKK